jgi:hypothetical protein
MHQRGTYPLLQVFLGSITNYRQMEEFKKCWERNQNNVRTSTVDNDAE